MWKLFKIGGFLPYLFVVFLNAFTDLGHKIIIQNTVFKVYDGSEQIILTAIVNGLILLPFILLFSPAGFISDRYQKDKVMQISAFFAVLITFLITCSYYFGLFWFSFFLTFLLAAQSAIYSPAKYGYIKELLGYKNISYGNGAVQAITIIAILLGIFIYSIGFETLIQKESLSETLILEDMVPLGICLFLGSLLELYLAYKLPKSQKKENMKKFQFNSYFNGTYLKKNLKLVKTNKIIFLSIFGLSLFWAISQVVLAVYPAYMKEYLDVQNVIVIQGLMAISAIGIIIGSLLGAKFSKNYIEVGMIPIGSFGIFLTILAIPLLDSLVLSGLNFFLFGLFGGILIVPLNSLIQFHTATKRLGVILSGNNFIQNIFMFTFLLFTVGFSFINISSIQIFYILALVSLGTTLYAVYKIPHSLIKFFVNIVFSIKYKLSVEGIENIPQNSGVLLLGNHISWLDWAFVQIASPRPIRFVMERSIYEKRLLKPFFDFFGVIPISSGGGKKSLLEVTKYLNLGEVVCIFPEGSISRSGHLGEFKKGFELATLGATRSVIIPFYLGGLWGTKWSRSNINFNDFKNNRYKKDVLVSFGKKEAIETNTQKVKQAVFELSKKSWQKYMENFQSLDHSFIETVKREKNKIALVEGSNDEEYSYYKTMVICAMLRDTIKKHPEQNIGILLPTSAMGAMVNIACLMASKTILNLNFTSSKESFQFTIKDGGIARIYTSKRFLEKLAQKGILIDTSLCEFIYLEDLKTQFSKISYLSHQLLIRTCPTSLLVRFYGSKNTLDTIGAILFSSGSEGDPKGVMLSHRNILANIKQITEMLNMTEDEVFLGSLPIFHAFGLTVTTLLPMIEGIKLITYPDPTDGYAIGKVVAKNRVTFMCATSTFIRLYLKNKKLNPLMFESLNMVFAGAEKLNPSVANEFKQRFGVEVYEGYGATECSPVISANIPDNLDMNYWQVQVGKKQGSIGMPLPGCAVKIVNPDTLEELPLLEDGLILASGVNVMVGYHNNPQKTKDSLVKIDGEIWYKTGDKGHIDADGFLTIVDRYSRFAKIGGEMVSLTAVENKIYEILSTLHEDIKLVCVTLPDEKKGEKIVLLLNTKLENPKQILLENGMEPLLIPAEIKIVSDIPLLGSGKVNFVEAKKLAIEIDF